MKKKLNVFLLIQAALLFLVACDLNSPYVDDAETAGLKKSLRTLNEPLNLANGSPSAMSDVAISEPVSEPDENGFDELGMPVVYKTTLQKFKASAAFDTQVLLNPSTDVIYPGSVLMGHTINDGSYMEVTSGTKRAVTVSYDLTGVKNSNGGNGYVSGSIEPTLSNFREFHSALLGQDIPGQSSIYTYEYTEINDESEMDLKFNAGANYTSPAIEVSVKAGFEYAKSNKRNKYMIKFMQTFYTVDIDQGNGTFLYDSFNLEDFRGYRPVYVSSVAYGRLAYLTIESSESWESIKASLDVIVNTAAYGDYNADFNAEMTKLKSETKFNITVIGGTSVTTSVDGFDQFLREGGFSETNSGKIISYKLRFVDDNTVANTIFNGEYTVRKVEAVEGNGIKIGLRTSKLKSDGGDGGWGDSTMEYFGNVSFKTGSSSYDLWSRSSSNSYDMGLTATHNLSESGFPFKYHTFNTSSDQLSVNITGFHELDDNSGNDSYSSPVVTKTIGALNDGDTFEIKATEGSNYVIFTVTVDKEILY